MPMPMQGIGASEGVSNKEILAAINEMNSVLAPEPEEGGRCASSRKTAAELRKRKP